MTPAFNIVANGDDITALINDRLKEVVITDEAGLKADALNISIDDRDGAIALPESGAQIAVSMGYVGQPLEPMGAYISDEVQLTLKPQSMTIRGQSADMSGPIKAPKTRNWDKITVKDIVEKIAGEHGFQAAVDDEIGAFTYKHIAQTNESDLHLLTRLSKTHDAIAAIKNGYVLFSAKGAGKSVTGQDLPRIEIRPTDIKSGTCTLTSRDKYKQVIARWNDKKARKKRDVIVGEGAPTYSIRHTYPTEEEAQKAAQSKLDDFRRGRDKLSLYMVGNPLLAAETQLLLIGFRNGVDGQWSIKTATHRINTGGYMTDIVAEKPTAVQDDEE